MQHWIVTLWFYSLCSIIKVKCQSKQNVHGLVVSIVICLHFLRVHSLFKIRYKMGKVSIFSGLKWHYKTKWILSHNCIPTIARKKLLKPSLLQLSYHLVQICWVNQLIDFQINKIFAKCENLLTSFTFSIVNCIAFSLFKLTLIFIFTRRAVFFIWATAPTPKQ